MLPTIFAVLQGSVTLYVLFTRIWPNLNFGQTDDGNTDQHSKRREKKRHKSKSPRKENRDSRAGHKKRAPAALSRAMLFATVRDTDNFVPTGQSLASAVCDEIECEEVNREKLNEEHEVDFEEENLSIVVSDEPELGNVSESVEKLSAEEYEVELEDEVEDSEKFFQEEEDINCHISTADSAVSVESEEIEPENSQEEEETNRHQISSVTSVVSIESEIIRLDDFTPEEDSYYKSLEVIPDESTATVTEEVDVQDAPVDEVQDSPLHRAAMQEYSRTCAEYNMKEVADDHSKQESGDGRSQYWGL